MSSLIEIRQPEGGAEHPIVYTTHHRCPQANALIRVLDEPDELLDLLIFPVGQVGYAMPLDIPFTVDAVEPCGGCGRYLTAHFVWRRGHTHFPGRIWTPDEMGNV